MLSRTATTLVPIPLLDEDAPLGREQFELLARPILERTVAATRAALRSASVPESAVAGLYLVGGSSRIPLVATLLHRGLRIAPTVIEQPELVVAEGSLYIPPVVPALEPEPVEPARGVAAVPAPATSVAVAEAPAPVAEVSSAEAPAAVAELPVEAGAEPPVEAEAEPPPGEPAVTAGPTVVRRNLAVAFLVLFGAVTLIAFAALKPDLSEVIIGTNAALAAVTSPLPLGLFLLALAGVGVPARGARPGPIRWVLSRAGWAVAGLTPTALVLADQSNLESWSTFAYWYRSAVWVPLAGALVFLVVCLWLLLGSLSRKAPEGWRTRLGAALAAMAMGVLCGLWWFASGYTGTGDTCSWAGDGNDLCDVGAGLAGMGGAGNPLGWLLFATGAFAVLGSVGLCCAILRMLATDRLRRTRPVLSRIGVALFILAAVLLADLTLADHTAAVQESALDDPLAQLTNWLGTSSRTAYYNGFGWFSLSFLGLVIAAVSLQVALRARASRSH
jgi:hypothetical protein